MKKLTFLVIFVAIATFVFAQAKNIILLQKTDNNLLKLSNNKNLKSIQAIDYFEDFQGTSPVYTTINVDGNTDDPLLTAYGYNFSSGWTIENVSGSNYVTCSNSMFSPTGQADRWFFTPAITLTAANPTLSWKAQSLNSAALEAYNIYVTTTIAGANPAPSDFTAAAVYTTTNEQAASLVQYNVNLTYPSGTTIYVAFRHVSNNKMILCIDDIMVGSNIVNDLEVQKSYLYNTLFGYAGSIPRTQADAISFSQTVKNNGSAAQNNVTLSVNLKKNTSSVFTSSSTSVASIASGAKDSLVLINTYTPSATGTGYELYEADFNVAAASTVDDIPSTNFDTVYFNTSEKDFSRCFIGNSSLNTTNLTISGGGDGMIVANDFYFPNQEILDSIYINLYTGTSATGVTIKGLLYTVDISTGIATQVDSTLLYSIVTADINTRLTLPFVSSYNVLATDYLRAGFRLTYGANTVDWLIDAGEYMPIDAGVYYLPNSSLGADWYNLSIAGTSLTPYVGLITHVGPSKINNVINQNKIIIYPNPSNGIINITNAEAGYIYIYNILGEVVTKYICNSNHSTIDLSNLSQGQYIVKIVSEKNTFTQKINIVK